MKEDSEYDLIIIEEGTNGKRLRKPITVQIPRAKRPGEKALNEYIINSFAKKMPTL